ncbi:HD domain-containing protein [Fontisphaera persica]|uniref:HD domain-containing protein n=1 Tax=Fontisphaera persica TaxID=2974023 RepID=UPI0024BF5313|nr:HD domain-containing protein [Fontisphaera persica]WCJ58648.1 HD domain-containing protein [Fontisphaera persica]
MNMGKGKIGVHGKVFRDPIHGLIRIEPEDEFILDLINTPEFQRLRRVRQLGVSSLTYPGAEHSRFSHSLGVFCFAQRMLNMLLHRYRGKSEVTDLLAQEGKTVKAAALLHDIGHAPFSHMMERAFPATANHEKRTTELITDKTSSIPHILQAHGIDPHGVRDIIKKASEHRLLVDIVSSQLDADRMDYILRDALATGVKYGAFDAEWLLNSLCIGAEPGTHSPAKPSEWRLCLEEKRGLHSAEQLIIARMHMSLQVYYHKTTRGWEAHLLCLFKHAADLAMDKRLPKGTNKIAQAFFASQGRLKHADFLACDEATLVATMQAWAQSNGRGCERLRELSAGYLNREKKYRCADVSAADTTQMLKLTSELNRLGKEYFDWVLDTSDFNSYKDFHSGLNKTEHGDDASVVASTEAILVANGELGGFSRPVEGQSKILGALGKKDSRHPVYRLYYHHGLAENVLKILDKMKLTSR